MSDTMTRQTAGQVLVAGFAGREVPAALLEQARDGLVGGVILFRRNLGDVHDVAAMVNRLADSFPSVLPPMVAIDQEGGRVQRLRHGVLQLPPMGQLGALDDPELCRRAGQVLGRQLGALGFTMNFAPVLDVNSNPQNPVIGDRAFGETATRVIRLALPFADGLREGGVGCCGKHFPGHGDTDLDSHLALPRLSHDRQRLSAVELPPFRAARGRVDAIMSAHVVFESLAPGLPGTLSDAVLTGLLRRELGFEGLIVSDDLEMKAVADRYPVGEAACRAIEAGCDVLLICSRLDWIALAREALFERARDDPAFARRLADAARRSLAFRTARRPAPITDPASLDRALTPPEAQVLRDELEHRLEA